jgi:hypothetical protein
MMGGDDTRRIVEAKLNAVAMCRGHCNERSILSLSEVEGELIGTYACPSGYVSRLINYGDVDVAWFREFVSQLLRGAGEVTDEDIRVATRYAWDLNEGVSGPVLKEAYWNQNYRRTQSDDPKRDALFSCTNCRSFYVQRISGKERLCLDCRRRGKQQTNRGAP